MGARIARSDQATRQNTSGAGPSVSSPARPEPPVRRWGPGSDPGGQGQATTDQATDGGQDNWHRWSWRESAGSSQEQWRHSGWQERKWTAFKAPPAALLTPSLRGKASSPTGQPLTGADQVSYHGDIRLGRQEGIENQRLEANPEDRQLAIPEVLSERGGDSEGPPEPEGAAPPAPEQPPPQEEEPLPEPWEEIDQWRPPMPPPISPNDPRARVWAEAEEVE